MNIGRYVAEIVSHRFRCTQKGTDFIELTVSAEGETVPISIWMTHKSMGMARAQLLACGFDIEKQGLEVLEEQPTFLAGNKIPIDVDDEVYEGKTTRKAQIAMKDKPDPARIQKLSAEMKEAKAPRMEAAAVDFVDPVDDGGIPF